jgi:hypothetical protein
VVHSLHLILDETIVFHSIRSSSNTLEIFLYIFTFQTQCTLWDYINNMFACCYWTIYEGVAHSLWKPTTEFVGHFWICPGK